MLYAGSMLRCVGSAGALVALALVLQGCGVLPASGPAPTPSAGVNSSKPYMGWSSWSLTGSGGPGYGRQWFNQAAVLVQSDAMKATLQPHGYLYVNLDSGWSDRLDGFGRHVPNPSAFPDLPQLSRHIHANGQKFGLYLEPGLPRGAIDQNAAIKGTSCHARDVAVQPLQIDNHFKGTYRMDFTNRCAQAYVDSVAEQLHGWGVNFLKLDAVAGGPSGEQIYDTRDDVIAYGKALRRYGIWLELSSHIEQVVSWMDTWRQYSQGWRVGGDVECYRLCSPSQLTIWSKVSQRFESAPQLARFAGPSGWNDFDSLDIGNGAMDNLSEDERQTTMTLWAISAVPLYTGDDLSKLDPYGRSLLTNDEVIAVDQAGRAAKPVSQVTPQQVWSSRNPDGSLTVALFNLADSPATVTASWSDLGVRGTRSIRDLWARRNLGSSADSFSSSLPPHGSRLLTVR